MCDVYHFIQAPSIVNVKIKNLNQKQPLYTAAACHAYIRGTITSNNSPKVGASNP